jgi:hypothetical protein
MLLIHGTHIGELSGSGLQSLPLNQLHCFRPSHLPQACPKTIGLSCTIVAHVVVELELRMEERCFGLAMKRFVLRHFVALPNPTDSTRTVALD